MDLNDAIRAEFESMNLDYSEKQMLKSEEYEMLLRKLKTGLGRRRRLLIPGAVLAVLMVLLVVSDRPWLNPDPWKIVDFLFQSMLVLYVIAQVYLFGLAAGSTRARISSIQRLLAIGGGE